MGSFEDDDHEFTEDLTEVVSLFSYNRRLANDDEVVFDTYIQENNSSKEECAICLEEYKDGETRAEISACKHRFHAACIKSWLKEHDNFAELVLFDAMYFQQYYYETDRLPQIIVLRVPANTPRPPPSKRRLENDEEVVFDTYIQENSSKEECAICLEEYKDGETRAEITACKHRFHAACIKSWLKENDNCPLCRAYVV
ncbi:hypothetical protein DH2020_003267 [Rehmannia glutinosa]|uniref:RING-type E3 ubiquitin transferase n=1 Tax=Rehmannia glutinosa TaxID=99300 RepID=A0ABR0XLK9_REHGL